MPSAPHRYLEAKVGHPDQAMSRLPVDCAFGVLFKVIFFKCLLL